MADTRTETSAAGRRLRAARNRLIDLLTLGETYPLRDLPVRDERLTVSVGGRADIPVENSERDVTYSLEPTSAGASGTDGTDGLLLIKTPPIGEDITFTIRAVSRRTTRETTLWNTAEVKVGLDQTLDANFLDVADSPSIVDFVSSVKIAVWQSQEGVDYRLVRDPTGRPPDDRRADLSRYQDLSGTMRGIGPLQTDNPAERSLITLTSEPLKEDTWILVCADKKFDASEGRQDRAAVLNVDLPMLVRANRKLAVSVDPSPIVDHKGSPKVKVAGSQASARYRAHARRVIDGAIDGVSVGYRHGQGDWPHIIRVPVDGAPTDALIVGLPAAPPVWDEPEGFAPVSDFVAGTGGDITIPMGGLSGAALTDDMLVIVEAEKRHTLADGGEFVSRVRLDQTVAVLVRPDPQPPLRLEVPVRNGTTIGELRVFDGQPGVFYHFRVGADGEPIEPPAYFHKRDHWNPGVNKGIGQLAIEVDFVVSRDQGRDPGVPEPPRDQSPPPPVLATKPLPADTVFSIRAVKAQTGVGIDLAPRAATTVAAPAPPPAVDPPDPSPDMPAPPADPPADR